MKTCYLVYRLTGEHRDLIGIYSTEEKTKAFIEVLEKVAKNAGVDVSYEYEEWAVE